MDLSFFTSKSNILCLPVEAVLNYPKLNLDLSGADKDITDPGLVILNFFQEDLSKGRTISSIICIEKGEDIETYMVLTNKINRANFTNSEDYPVYVRRSIGEVGGWEFTIASIMLSEKRVSYVISMRVAELLQQTLNANTRKISKEEN